ncbi:dihydroxyacetone kinase subunit DhaL [Tessaracoccus sp. OH4464_COT-324]|uniref:dihydroxyacetone kinase subunit DhaL n=1 Tax=Tessaracoccus sp. OH4464_COT-324 TaxID=2491059 RepID=UPI000F642531|nr:dihydroxyacetone kinase subunit DhaL [Tessaracoccus sp. OH4464_COT-324]RRD46957.1 dihydroxyacetone kinase subunit L [Tessaracoccus sp. OH4464_COT-324]
MVSRLGVIQGWLAIANTAFGANAGYLDRLDRAIGDGDHGTNMARGFSGAAELDPGSYDSPQQLLRQVGMHLLGSIGGASGALYGTFFLTLASRWSSEMNTPRLAAAMRAARDAVQARGRAEVGDKTLVDALHAAVCSLEAEDSETPIREAISRAAEAAQAASQGVRDAVAKRGRAALLGEATVGHLDPGAESMTILFQAAARHLG